MKKHVYLFGDGKAEGDKSMKNLLGGKGANLAEMNLIGVPVPAGFTITTEVCTMYNQLGKDHVIDALRAEVEQAIANTEKVMNAKFKTDGGDFPLLLSVRSGARVSMPGMMNTVLNLGLNDTAVEILAQRSNNPRFAYDSYRRFIQMYGDVVMGVEAEEGQHCPFEMVLDKIKESKGYKSDTDFTVEDLKDIVNQFKAVVRDHAGRDFPNDPMEQLWGAVCAVFDSWNTERAILYRQKEQIPEEWGTAVNVQAMVYGNMGETSATGVCFSRDSGTGEDLFNGEYLINAQGEDVVAGVRTPLEITKIGSQRWAERSNTSEEDRKANFASLEEAMPKVYAELNAVQQKLEDHYNDMQDMEFTVQDGKLWMLQTRSGKRTGAAMVRIGMEMYDQGLINEQEVLMRQDANKLTELLLPVFDQASLASAVELAKGLPASPGAATGQIVFSASKAEKVVADDDSAKVILVRRETSPEDLKGMYAAQGILTQLGGMTSHAAVVARGMGKCCVSGAEGIVVTGDSLTIGNKVYKEGDWISLNGTTGKVYEGTVKTVDAELSDNYKRIMEFAKNNMRMYVRANADTPEDAKKARSLGAKGIGLCRSEHMFFEGDKIIAMREMILSKNKEERQKVLNEKVLPMQREDFEGIMEAMDGYGVTVRLLDPPLHEFVPHTEAEMEVMAKAMGISTAEVKAKVDSLHEANPMLGHRGCRLGITYPEITEMQARAIIEAACNLKAKGLDPKPEIMVPLIGTIQELDLQKKVIVDTAQKVMQEKGVQVEYLVGTMIETPRAALTAGRIAETAQFFSFGTNDLTQMTFGYSRDDAGKFLPEYIDKGILKVDPFVELDQEGVGQLVRHGVQQGRTTNPELKVGICGEHGGEPTSVKFFETLGMEYVSCSPYRVPVAIVAAAQGALENK